MDLNLTLSWPANPIISDHSNDDGDHYYYCCCSHHGHPSQADDGKHDEDGDSGEVDDGNEYHVIKYHVTVVVGEDDGNEDGDSGEVDDGEEHYVVNYHVTVTVGEDDGNDDGDHCYYQHCHHDEDPDYLHPADDSKQDGDSGEVDDGDDEYYITEYHITVIFGEDNSNYDGDHCYYCCCHHASADDPDYPHPADDGKHDEDGDNRKVDVSNDNAISSNHHDRDDVEGGTHDNDDIPNMDDGKCDEDGNRSDDENGVNGDDDYNNDDEDGSNDDNDNGSLSKLGMDEGGGETEDKSNYSHASENESVPSNENEWIFVQRDGNGHDV